ncbi:MAG: deoxyribose-phosphate aldolase [Candidatus Atribacteria bacterium]|nr:deoxyribose-phosphate aldolase [Candidatus Atribacteria bacterium]
MPYQLNRIIDQTMLRPNATRGELECFCEEALYYNFICVALLPNVIQEASFILKGSQTHIMAAISYPRGMVPIDIKKKEIEEAINDGADEIDMVLNLEVVKNHKYKIIENEMTVLRESTGTLTAKAILETTLLSDEEIIQLCQLASDIGIDFVKSSTGFNGNQASIHAIQLMKKSVFKKTQVKAAGGISNLSKFLQMLKAGATRIGTSAGPLIIEEYKTLGIDIDTMFKERKEKTL